MPGRPALAMDNTRSTLLVRLRDRSDENAWRTFDDLYRTMLVGYARARGLSQADAEDVAQQCVQVVLEQIREYAHAGSFKTWLRAIAEHKMADFHRRRGRESPLRTGVLNEREDPTPELGEMWERHWSMAHLRYCAEAARREVAETTYAAFLAYAVEGRPAETVASLLGMTVNQVYVSKHRVLERIRALMADLTGQEPEESLP
jgi:RNA polymerase sigma factor (sigma-70 family)